MTYNLLVLAAVKLHLSVIITFLSLTTLMKISHFLRIWGKSENFSVVWSKIVSYKIKIVLHIVAVSAAVLFLYLKK